MLQTLMDPLFDVERTVFVVDFDTMPELPITWSTPEEEPYAKAFDDAIRTGAIKQPGKYGIALDKIIDPTVTLSYSIYTIKE